MVSSISDVAKRLFNAYNENGPNPWKTFDGRDVPRWEGLNDQVRAKWEAAAGEALRFSFEVDAEVRKELAKPLPPDTVFGAEVAKSGTPFHVKNTKK